MNEVANPSQLGELLKKHSTAVGFGFLMALTMVLVLTGKDFWGIYFFEGNFNPIIFATNTIGFLLIWLLASFLIVRLSLVKVLLVFCLLVVVTISSQYLKLPANNPITIPALLLFWMGIAYLLLPSFFKKYQWVIFALYGTMICYFYLVRTSPNYQVMHVRILSYFLTITVSFTFILWMYQQLHWLISVKVNRTDTELELLKSRVNPHFFFNTLNNLYGLVVEKSDQAPEVILKLSDMMRYTIYEGDKKLVLLSDEIAYLESYVELHKIRYQKKVDIKFNHSIHDQVKVPPLLFINLLENAFKHGVEGLTEDAFIHMELGIEKKQLHFKIANNYDLDSPDKKGGIGLANLKKRLTLIFPKKHQFEITKINGRYTAKMVIPIH